MVRDVVDEHSSSPDDEPHRWKEILDFEREWRRGVASKQAAVRRRFGISPARYYQLLNRSIDQPEALQYDAMLVRRLRRLRETRRRKRFVGRLAVPS